jgi:biotin carboxyl carrier protein
MIDKSVSRIGAGMFAVTTADGRKLVYVAGSRSDRWAWWNGRLFHSTGPRPDQPNRVAPAGASGVASQSLTAPMPATVIKVLVAAGDRVKGGETVVLLEAMKMELPVRALGPGTVRAVHCRAGDLVAADQELVELE